MHLSSFRYNFSSTVFMPAVIAVFLASNINLYAAEDNSEPYSVQVGAFKNRANAQRLSEALIEKGYPAFVPEKKDDDKKLFKVFVGSFYTKDAARQEAEKIFTKENLPCIVVLNNDNDLTSADRVEKPVRVLQNDPGRQISADGGREKKDKIKECRDNSKTLSFFQGLPLKVHAEIEPSLSWQLHYEDNVYGTAENKVSDFSNRYLPDVKFDIISERLKLSGTAKLEIIEYVDERGYNTVDQDYSIEATYSVSKRSSLLLSGNYSVNTDPNRYFQLEPEDVGSLALVGSYVVKKYKTKTKMGTLLYQYLLSPRSSIIATCSYSNFNTGVTDSSDFYLGLLNYIYKMNPTLQFNVNQTFSYMHFKFGGKAEEGDTDFIVDLVSGGDYDVFLGSDFKSKIYLTNAGFSSLLGTGSSLNCSMGWSRNVQNITTEARDPETGEPISNSRRTEGDTLNYNIMYQYALSNTKFKMSLQQSAGDNANTGTSFRSRQLGLSITHDFTKRLQGGWKIQYKIYRADENDFGFEINRRILYTGLNFSYVLTRWLNFIVNYQFTNNNARHADSRTQRNTVYAALTMHALRPYIFQ